MRIVHTDEVRLFREVMGLEQSLVQKLSARSRQLNWRIFETGRHSINDTVVGVLMHMQEKYSQLMLQDLLERDDIVKKTIYNLRNPITTVFSAVEELLEFSEITRKLYTQFQAINITYVILHWTGKFGLLICEWNYMTAVQKMWVCFKQYFQTSHRELRETSGITIEDAGIYYANMVRDIVAGLQESLQQDQTQMETPTIMQAPVDHVANVVQITHQQLATQLQQIQSMIQTM